MIFVIQGAQLSLIAQDNEPMGVDFKIKKVEINELPNNNEGTPGRPAITSIDKNWIEIFVEYEVHPKRDTKPATPAEAFTPEVQFNFVMGIDDVTKPKGKEWYDSYSFFSTEVVYLNVYDGAPHYASVYIHPNLVKRYGGSSAFRSNTKAFVYVEISAGGKKKDAYSTDKALLKNIDWKSAISTTSGVLLKKTKTPWNESWWGTYEMIKE